MTDNRNIRNLASLKSSGDDNDIEEKINKKTLDDRGDYAAKYTEKEMNYRFVFVDGYTGRWSLDEELTYSSHPVITCPLGGSVVFHYSQGYHDVVSMASEDHYEQCNFADHTVLSPAFYNEDDSLDEKSRGVIDHLTYYHYCNGTEENSKEYISCSIPGHCNAGQKIVIVTDVTARVYDEDEDEWLVHSSSLRRIQNLLGYRFDESISPFLIMDRGFQTEELAEKTLEWIWCGLDHCPEFANDVQPDATKEDCESIIYTLMGYVNRKKPIPDFIASQQYYERAIALGGNNNCAARSYKTKMYLDQGQLDEARAEADLMCRMCYDENLVFNGGTNLAVYQALYEIQDETTRDLLVANTSCANVIPMEQATSGCRSVNSEYFTVLSICASVILSLFTL